MTASYRSIAQPGEIQVVPPSSKTTGASSATSYEVGGVQVVGARATGWTAPTGTAARTTFATYAGQEVSGSYDDEEVQAIDDHVKVLSQRLKALIDDLTTHGLIGT